MVKFIEDNWLGGESITGSFDKSSGSLYAKGGLLDFNVRPHLTPLILDPTTGAVVSGGRAVAVPGRALPLGLPALPAAGISRPGGREPVVLYRRIP